MIPTILVDMDGVLADFDQHYWNEAVRVWKQVRAGSGPLSPFDISALNQQAHRYLSDHVTDKDCESAVRSLVETEGWFEALPPIDGARSGLNRLSKAADVWIVTKPLEKNPTCRDEKARWLTKHMGDGWDRRLILTPDKSLIRGDVLLDDAIKPEWVPAADWEPVVYAHPWNTNGPHAGPPTPGWDRFEWGDGAERLLRTAINAAQR